MSAYLSPWANNACSEYGNWIYCKLESRTNILKINCLEIFLNSKTRRLTVRTALVEPQSCRCSCWSSRTRSRLVSAGTSAGRIHLYVRILGKSMKHYALPCAIVYEPMKDVGENLHGSVNLSAFEHEDEVPKVSHCCLPRNVFGLISEETGGIQSQSHVDIFGPERHRNCTVVFFRTRVHQQHTWAADTNGSIPCQIKSVVDELSSVHKWD